MNKTQKEHAIELMSADKIDEHTVCRKERKINCPNKLGCFCRWDARKNLDVLIAAGYKIIPPQ